MRRLFLALMILLLPLRGWVGDAMALEMATRGSAAAQNTIILIAENPHQSSDSTRFHSDSQPAAASGAHCDGHGDGTDESPNHNTVCFACEVCHTVAITDHTLPPGLLALPVSTPLSATFSDTSAANTRAAKPPIS